MDLLAQPGASDLKGIIRGSAFQHHYWVLLLIMFCRASFGNKMTFDSPFVPFVGNVKIAVAAAKLPYIRFPINAGAENILVFLAVAGCQPAGTGHITVTILVDQKRPQELKGFFLVPVKVIALGFLDLAQRIIQIINLRSHTEHIFYLLQFHADDNFITVNEGWKGAARVGFYHFLNSFFLLVWGQQVNNNRMVLKIQIIKHFLGYLAMTAGAQGIKNKRFFSHGHNPRLDLE